MRNWTEEVGLKLKMRLPVYDKYIRREWLSEKVYNKIIEMGWLKE